jgi:hypothetical protein
MPILLNAVRDPEKKACAVSKSYRRKLVRARIGTAAAYRGVLEASTSLPKERYAVSNDSLDKLIQPGAFDPTSTVYYISKIKSA